MEAELPAKIIGASVDILQNLFARYEAHTNAALKNEALLRTYYLETIANIDLIDAVLPNIDNKTPITDEAFQTFINSLQTKTAAAILFSEETQNCKAFKTLLKKSGAYNIEDEDETGRQTARKDTILMAMLFVISKIEFLKTIPQCGFQDLLHAFRLKIRLTNIKESLLAIKKIMEATILKK